MIRAMTARRIAAAAAFGGGGITVLGGVTFGLIVAEAKLARKIIESTPSGVPPETDGLYGAGSAAALERAGGRPAAGRRADQSGGRAGRPVGLAGQHAGRRVRHGAARNVLRGSLPSVCTRLRRGSGGDATVDGCRPGPGH